MKPNHLSWLAAGIGLFLLGLGAAGMWPERAAALNREATAAVVTDGIIYQGRLTDDQGLPLDGSFTMRFIVYDDPVAGTARWDSGNISVNVSNGLFSTTLGVNQSDFDGRALWVQIIVGGEALSPRQEITPAPYALSLRPGAEISDATLAPSEYILALVPNATGYALFANANTGVGVLADSETNYAVYGTTNSGTAGYFSTVTGTGLRVQTNGSDHYDHGALIDSNGGYAVFGRSDANMAVRGEAGDVTGIPSPFGRVGVVGMGQSRGVHAASDGGLGIYARSHSSYGGYFYSTDFRALYATSPSGDWAGYFTNRGGSTQPGLFVNGTLQVTGAKTGFVVDISQNGGSEPLQPGDVVAVVGVSDPVLGDIPTMQVVKATADTAGAVIGVVDQRYILNEDPEGEQLVQPDMAAADQRGPAAGVQPGDYVSVVTLGAFRVIKVDAAFGAIQPGDLLTASPNPGYAMKAADPVPGTIIGKALEAWDGGTGEIGVYVTLQ